MRFLLDALNQRGEGVLEYGMLVLILAVLVIAVLMLIWPSTSNL